MMIVIIVDADASGEYQMVVWWWWWGFHLIAMLQYIISPSHVAVCA
jgi:hypothetical protein